MSDKEKVSAVLSVVLTAIIALLAVFGYHVVIVQPQLAALDTAAHVITIANPAGVALTIDAGAAITVAPLE